MIREATGGPTSRLLVQIYQRQGARLVLLDSFEAGSEGEILPWLRDRYVHNFKRTIFYRVLVSEDEKLKPLYPEKHKSKE